MEKKAEDIEALEQQHAKQQADIAKLSAQVAKAREECESIAVEQSQTQAPDHSSELAALRLEKQDAQQTVSAAYFSGWSIASQPSLRP